MFVQEPVLGLNTALMANGDMGDKGKRRRKKPRLSLI